MSKSLDLGCGNNPRNHFNADEAYGIDVRDDLGNNVVKADLVIEPIPFGDNEFDFVTAFDFLEHVPRILYVPHRRNAFVEIMNEIWRVLKPGGHLYSFTPAFPHATAFRDPTHVNIITDETFPLYFGTGFRWAAMYGFTGNFEVVSQTWQIPHLISILKKIDV
ncbi:MAG: class I SAM-dependent methyltransferase [Verrucomicrobiota bacterium]